VEPISHKRHKSSRNHQRLSILELDSLELRRVRAALLFTYKLVFGLTDVNLHNFFRTTL